jgi:DNA-binding LacI/PurR family transcriptional regulator
MGQDVPNRPWPIGINPDTQAGPLARDIVRLLLDHPGAERPAGLMVGDDSLLDAALQGIEDVGLSAPRDLTVVAHANHPEPDQPAMPCIRLGLDLRHMLRPAAPAEQPGVAENEPLGSGYAGLW